MAYGPRFPAITEEQISRAMQQALESLTKLISSQHMLLGKAVELLVQISGQNNIAIQQNDQLIQLLNQLIQQNQQLIQDLDEFRRIREALELKLTQLDQLIQEFQEYMHHHPESYIAKPMNSRSRGLDS